MYIGGMWTDLFRSRYVRFLEDELASVRTRHAKELETLKKTHAEELSRAITEANRGWAEADRLRMFLVPGLPARAETTQAESKPPTAEESGLGGTPFEKLKKREWERQKQQAEEAERNAKIAKQFPTPKESTPVPPA